MKIYWKFIFIIIFVPLIFTGCWDQKIYEQIGFILQLGIESSEEKNLLVSYTSPVTEATKREQVELVYDNVDLVREFREKARTVSAKSLEGGKAQQVVISKELAEKGTRNLLEIMERDPSNPAIAYVIISERSPRELFDFLQKLSDKPRPSFYLNQLIENNFKTGRCPNTSIFDFTLRTFALGMDPITPTVRIKPEGGKGIEITGSALFSEDKMVGKIDTARTCLLLAMMGNMRSTEYIFRTIGPPKNDITGKKGAAVLLHKPKKKIKIQIEKDIPVVTIDLKFKGDFEEHEWDHIDKKYKQEEYEKIMAKELKNECMNLLKYTQEIGSDPIGIGNLVRAKHNSYWKSHDWKEVYKNVVFNVNVKLNIQRYGVIK